MMTRKPPNLALSANLETLLTDVGTCILGCIDADGFPYQTPVNFECADGGFYLVALERTLWSHHVRHNGRVALYITYGSRRVLVQGTAEQVDEPLFMRRILEQHRQRPAPTSQPAARGDQLIEMTRGGHSAAKETRHGACDHDSDAPMWFFVPGYDQLIQQGSRLARNSSRA